MEMQASRSLAVSQQQAWEALNDPETLKACLAGCDRFEPQGDDQYAVGMAVKVGPVSAKFSGKVTLSDITPPERYRIAFEGQGGVAGFGKGEADVTLTPEPADAAGQPRCLLSYSVQAQVGGKIAQLGQRLIDGAARNMADDFFARFDTLMQQRHPRAPAAPADRRNVLQNALVLRITAFNYQTILNGIFHRIQSQLINHLYSHHFCHM